MYTSLHNITLHEVRQRIHYLLHKPEKKHELHLLHERHNNEGYDQPLALDNDETLVKRAQKGDSRAFDQLVLKHGDRIMTLCFRYMGNRFDADDAAQEVFVKVYRSLNKFSFSSSFNTWLYRVTVNTCIDMLRKGGKASGEKEIMDNIHSGSEPGPEEITIMNEKEKMIHFALSQLPLRERTLVILADMDGRGMEEIAEIMKIKTGTVKSTLYRGRKRLRNLLRDVYHEL